MAAKTTKTAAKTAPKTSVMTGIRGTDDAAKTAVLARIENMGFRQIGKAGTLCYVEPDTNADYEKMLEFIEVQNNINNDEDDIALTKALLDAIGTPPDEAEAAVVGAVKTLTKFTCPASKKFTQDHNAPWNTFRGKKREAIYVMWFPSGTSPKAKTKAKKSASADTKQAAAKAAEGVLARLMKK